MAGTAEYRTEHIAETPRGWRVRMKAPGPQSQHLVAIAFPPGGRKKGSGRLVEILHPANERNPRCEVSEKAKKNPGELLVFGNPSGYVRRSLYHQLQEAAKERGESFKQESMPDGRIGYRYQGKLYTPGELAAKLGVKWPNPSTQAAKRATRERAARIRGARLNPKREQLRKRIKALEAKFYTAMDRLAAARRAGGVMSPEYIAIEKETDKLSHDLDLARRLHGAAFNPSVQRYAVYKDNVLHAVKSSLKEADREAIRVRESGHAAHVVGPRQFFNKKLGNPVRMQVFHDPAIKKFTAVIYDPKFGNLYASGFTKKQAAQALRDRVREYRRSGRLPAGGGYGTPNKANPRHRRKDRERRNPDETEQAVRLFEKFHGRDPKDITEKHVSAAVRKDYTALGDLEHLRVITPLGQTAQFNFEGDGIKLASSPDGKQLYCIGGNQNLSSCLDHASLEKDFVDLGECEQVQYLARKVHANFEPTSYYHKFGEKTGARPQLAYDKLKRQIFFVGGEYFIDTKHGVSPGIEN